MTDITKIEVRASSRYDVLIASGILCDCGRLISEVIAPCRALVLTDDVVAPLYLGTVRESLAAAGFDVCEYIIPHGENSKNLDSFCAVLEYLAELKFSRTDILIALGGGVVGDLCGFCASTYLRGVKFVGIPTTLLSAVDSSVGGKTAVDLRGGKNLCGSFWQPSRVICDIDTFATLSDDIFADGIAESVKYGIICDRALFDAFDCCRHELDILHIVTRCVEIKRDIVQRDEFDNGERKLLNLGHTIAHSIEALSEYTISHGHAVAVGTVYISRVAAALGYADRDMPRTIAHTLSRYGLASDTVYTPAQLASVAMVDKKVAGGSITLVMPHSIGKCTLERIALCQLEDYIARGDALK